MVAMVATEAEASLGLVEVTAGLELVAGDMEGGGAWVGVGAFVKGGSCAAAVCQHLALMPLAGQACCTGGLMEDLVSGPVKVIFLPTQASPIAHLQEVGAQHTLCALRCDGL